MAKPHFTYFDGRGLGECVRMLLAAGGVEVHDSIPILVNIILLLVCCIGYMYT